MARANSSSQCVAGMSRPSCTAGGSDGKRPPCGPQSKPNRPLRWRRLVEAFRPVGHLYDLAAIGSGQVQRVTRPDELVALARRLGQPGAVEDRDLAAATGDQAGPLELPGGVADGGALDA